MEIDLRDIYRKITKMREEFIAGRLAVRAFINLAAFLLNILKEERITRTERRYQKNITCYKSVSSKATNLSFNT